ncbi:MAG: HpsJ family protein [Cyanobacteriota bacterium]|nr:HpsJ family protein [Cyanobacteriota bacterium]
MSSFSPSRLPLLLRWMGGVQVLVLLLQLLSVLVANAWGEEAFRQLLADTLIKGAPLALLGLLLMLIADRLDQPGPDRTPLRWTVMVLSGLLALGLLFAVPVSVAGNSILEGQADQAVTQKRTELDRARQESRNPQLIEALTGQLRQTGQVPPEASAAQVRQQVQRFIDGRLSQLQQQLNQAERARSLTLGQRRFSGTAVALVLALAAAALAAAAVL